MNWKHILNRIDYWKKQDEKWQQAMEQFCKVVAPKEYAPILNPKYIEGFIEGVSGENKELKDWLEYYAYEVPGMDQAKVTDKDGRGYNFCDKDDTIRFFEDNYPVL